MSIFSKIGGLFTGKSAEKTVDNLLDKDSGILVKVGGFINDLHLSDAEKAELAKKTGDAIAKFAVDTMSESTVRSKTRRTIAVEWIRVQLFMLLATFAMVSHDQSKAKVMWDIATSEIMFWGTMAVLGFFFGAYYAATGRIPGLPKRDGKG